MSVALLRAWTALNRIASWPEGPVVLPSFDEPSSAATARAAIASMTHAHTEPGAGTGGPQCLITGCGLLDSSHNRVVWGDLHCLGPVGIFNACLNPNHEAAWVGVEKILDSTPTVTLVQGQPIFERRAVIVFDLCSAEFNKAATDRAKL